MRFLHIAFAHAFISFVQATYVVIEEGGEGSVKKFMLAKLEGGNEEPPAASLRSTHSSQSFFTRNSEGGNEEPPAASRRWPQSSQFFYTGNDSESGSTSTTAGDADFAPQPAMNDETHSSQSFFTGNSKGGNEEPPAASQRWPQSSQFFYTGNDSESGSTSATAGDADFAPQPVVNDETHSSQSFFTGNSEGGDEEPPAASRRWTQSSQSFFTGNDSESGSTSTTVGEADFAPQPAVEPLFLSLIEDKADDDGKSSTEDIEVTTLPIRSEDATVEKAKPPSLDVPVEAVLFPKGSSLARQAALMSKLKPSQRVWTVMATRCQCNCQCLTNRCYYGFCLLGDSRDRELCDCQKDEYKINGQKQIWKNEIRRLRHGRGSKGGPVNRQRDGF